MPNRSPASLSPQALLLELVSCYDLPTPVECRLLNSGFHDTFLVSAGEARYVLKLYRPGFKTRSEVVAETEALLHLGSKGVRAALPVKKRDGGYAWSVSTPGAERQALLFTDAAGKPVSDLDVASCRLLGRALAAIHREGDGFEGCGPGFRACDLAVFRFLLGIGDGSLAPELLWEAHAELLWKAYLEGYREGRPLASIDLQAIPLFVPIRPISILGNIVRTHKPDPEGGLSNPGFFDQILLFLQAWEAAYLPSQAGFSPAPTRHQWRRPFRIPRPLPILRAQSGRAFIGGIEWQRRPTRSASRATGRSPSIPRNVPRAPGNSVDRPDWRCWACPESRARPATPFRI